MTGPDTLPPSCTGNILAPVIVRALVLASALLAAAPAVAEPPRTILFVFDEDPHLPGLAVIHRSLRETFTAELGGDVEFCAESLNLSQFKDPGYDGLLRHYFSQKYAHKTPDLIVAVMQPSLEFLLHDDGALFPGVPIVFCGLDSSYLERHPLPPNITGVAVKRAYAPTVDIALQLQPNTRHLFVVGGTAEFDRLIQAIARRDLLPYERRLQITYLTELPMPELLAATAKLPEKSAILYLTLFRDGARRAFVPHEALARITAVASAPTYVAVDQYLDRGVVGGHVYSLSTHGRQAAEIGVRILRGESTPPVAVSGEAAYANIFDWRQLQRWHLDEARLPSGSEVRHRTISAWNAYRNYIVAVATLAALQSALIVGLLVSRAQRRRSDAAARQAEVRKREAEAEVHRQRDELAHALRVTTLGELTASVAHEIGQPLAAILTNAQAVHRMAANGTMQPGELDEALRDIEDDVHRASATMHGLRVLFRKQPSEQRPVDLEEIVEDVMRLLRSDFLAKGIQVHFRRADRRCTVLGDAVQLRQVVLNLLVNAEDAITRNTNGVREIRIETRSPSADTVGLVVRDTGPGLKSEDLEWMFERFNSTKPQGLGMGLAISRTIVAAHRGRIWASRNEDRGLSLHVEFPASQDLRPAR